MNEGQQDKSERGSEISAVQVRMARVALGWGVRDLAAAAQISGDTLNRLERGDVIRTRTLAAVRHALEAAGIVFIAENGGGPGVRLRRSKLTR